MEAIIASIIIALASFSGLLFITKNAKKWLFKNIKFLVTFAAGIFLMTAISLAGETFEFLSNTKSLIAIVGGFLLMWVLHAIIPETHHHHDDSCPDCVPSNKGTKLLIGDMIHNIADGIVLVAAFSVSFELGIVAAVSIFIHEFVQEISEFFVLKQTGYSTKKALFWNFISALSILVGVAIGFLLTKDPGTQAVLIGISAGAFLHVVTHDLIPYREVSRLKNKKAWKHIGLFVLGILIIASLGLLTPHTHEDGDHGHEEGYSHDEEYEDEDHEEDDHDEHENEHHDDD